MCAYRKLSKADIDPVNEIQGAKILLTGDLNADPFTHACQKLVNFAHVNGPTVHISEPTMITPNSQIILDQFLSNMLQMIKSVNAAPSVSTNDHCTTEAYLLFRIRKSCPYVRTMWDFKHAHFELYREDINQCNWDECFNEDNIDIATEMWTSKIL